MSGLAQFLLMIAASVAIGGVGVALMLWGSVWAVSREDDRREADEWVTIRTAPRFGVAAADGLDD